MPIVNKGKKLNKELSVLCSNFNKNKSYDMFVSLVNMNPNYNNRNVCRCCGKELYYKNVTFKGAYQDYPTFLGGTTPYSQKIIESVVYHLSVCEECMREKFPEWDNLNTSRVFNRPNKYTQYAFNIPDDVLCEKTKELCVRTLESFCKKYGNDEGINRWNAYREKQRETNTFEYKNKRYGMTQEDFDLYNKSRSITLDNLVKKYGEEVGYGKWNEYLRKQRYSVTKEYFIERYGEEHGLEKWKRFEKNRLEIGSYSKISQELFSELCKNEIFSGHDVYFAENNFEYEIMTSDGNLYYLDFYDKTLGVCVEFNGIAFHPKHGRYSENDYFKNPFDSQYQLVSDIWKKEKHRYDSLESEYGIKTFVVWEDDYKKDKTKCICSVINNIIKYVKGSKSGFVLSR